MPLVSSTCNGWDSIGHIPVGGALVQNRMSNVPHLECLLQVSKVLGACLQGHDDQCRWSRIGQFERLWRESAPSDEAQQQWQKALGPYSAIMSGACAVVAFGGLGCFWVPVKMVFLGLILMLAVLYNTPTCSILPNLLFMSFMSKQVFLHMPTMLCKTDEDLLTFDMLVELCVSSYGLS